MCYDLNQQGVNLAHRRKVILESSNFPVEQTILGFVSKQENEKLFKRLRELMIESGMRLTHGPQDKSRKYSADRSGFVAADDN